MDNDFYDAGDAVWGMFRATGNVGYYLMFSELEKEKEREKQRKLR